MQYRRTGPVGSGPRNGGFLMDVSDYIGFVGSEGERFASAAGHDALSVKIAACPGWDMGDLVRHLGMIHLWAAANVAFPESDWLDVEELPDLVRYWPDLAGDSGEYPDDPELVAWYRDTLANLIEVLTSAPADVAAFTFLPAPTPLTMGRVDRPARSRFTDSTPSRRVASPPTSTQRSRRTCSMSSSVGSHRDRVPSTSSGHTSSMSTPRTPTNTGTSPSGPSGARPARRRRGRPHPHGCGGGPLRAALEP